MTRTLNESVGGERAVRALVNRFYDLMDTMPEAAGIRALHPETLDHSREKLFMLLTGWMGGPPLYVERFGHSRLRARHLPFPIGESERDQWLSTALPSACYGPMFLSLIVPDLQAAGSSVQRCVSACSGLLAPLYRL